MAFQRKRGAELRKGPELRDVALRPGLQRQVLLLSIARVDGLVEIAHNRSRAGARTHSPESLVLMPLLSRRAFLGWLAASLPASAIVRRAHAAAVADLAANPVTLRAMGGAVLPAEFGTENIAAAVERFQRWMSGYREDIELLHGYGTSRLQHSGPTPATRWATQLGNIDARSRRQHGRAFADLPLALRRDMIRDDLSQMKVDRLPSLGRAPHVALALLAHFYASPEATDLCYGAHIGKQTCRPLSASSRRPLPLAPRRA